MLEKKISYEDFNGNKVTETFYFHMSKDDVAEFKYRKDGSDIVDVISRIMSTENVRGVLDILKELARAGVGRKGEIQGRSVFIKDQEAKDLLFYTDAYSELMMELIENPTAASDFIAGMLPKDMAKNMREATKGEELHNLSKEEIANKMRELQELQQKTND